MRDRANNLGNFRPIICEGHRQPLTQFEGLTTVGDESDNVHEFRYRDPPGGHHLTKGADMLDRQTNLANATPQTEVELGQAWIKAITDGALERLQALSHPKVLGRLLLPAGLTTVHGPAELVAEYRAWFGSCTDFKLEASRVEHVGERLGVSYRLRLQDQGVPERIEQQIYFWLKDGRVQELHLVCSGFQLAAEANQEQPMDDA